MENDAWQASDGPWRQPGTTCIAMALYGLLYGGPSKRAIHAPEGRWLGSLMRALCRKPLKAADHRSACVRCLALPLVCSALRPHTVSLPLC